MLDQLTVDDFRPHVGSPFAVGDDGQDRLLELTAAKESRAHAGAMRAGFSLLFRGARASMLPQGVHRILHPTLGAMDIFLVPVGPDAQGMQYEAIFN